MMVAHATSGEENCSPQYSQTPDTHSSPSDDTTISRMFASFPQPEPSTATWVNGNECHLTLYMSCLQTFLVKEFVVDDDDEIARKCPITDADFADVAHNHQSYPLLNLVLNLRIRQRYHRTLNQRIIFSLLM